jgi:hypothetical protein
MPREELRCPSRPFTPAAKGFGEHATRENKRAQISKDCRKAKPSLEGNPARKNPMAANQFGIKRQPVSSECQKGKPVLKEWNRVKTI